MFCCQFQDFFLDKINSKQKKLYYRLYNDFYLLFTNFRLRIPRLCWCYRVPSIYYYYMLQIIDELISNINLKKNTNFYLNLNRTAFCCRYRWAHNAKIQSNRTTNKQKQQQQQNSEKLYTRLHNPRVFVFYTIIFFFRKFVVVVVVVAFFFVSFVLFCVVYCVADCGALVSAAQMDI